MEVTDPAFVRGRSDNMPLNMRTLSTHAAPTPVTDWLLFQNLPSFPDGKMKKAPLAGGQVAPILVVSATCPPY